MADFFGKSLMVDGDYLVPGSNQNKSGGDLVVNGRDSDGNIVEVPKDGESFSSWYKRVSKGYDPNSLWAKFYNFFNGDVSSAREYYQNWYNQQQVSKQAQADYEYTRMLRQTEYQDFMKAIESAGLNPYVLLSQGATASSSGSINSSPASYSSESKQNKTALIAMIYAIARIIAAVA